MKNPLENIFTKKSKNDLFVDAEKLMHAHFKGAFGDKISCTVSITNAKAPDELLDGACKIITTPSHKSHFIHFLK